MLQARKLRDLRHLAADVALVLDGDLHALGECGREGAERGTAEVRDGSPLIALLRRPQLRYNDLRTFDAGCAACPQDIAEQVEITVKYEGYIRRQMAEVAEFARLERRAIPEDIDYAKIDGLRLEAREKLAAIRPQNLGQAGRISGVSPADVAALMLYITSKTRD